MVSTFHKMTSFCKSEYQTESLRLNNKSSI
jgi:hypothetical protein